MHTSARPQLPHFAGGRFERDDVVRQDLAKLSELRGSADALFLPLEGLEPALGENGQLCFLPLHQQPVMTADTSLFLGTHSNGAPIFCLLNGADGSRAAAPNRANWGAISALSRDEAALYATARSVLGWHANHHFCAKCGGETLPVKGGWSRKCTGCGAEHFPRVDPVVIMLAEHEGRILLGRQPHFPAGQYSALAGFIEPGEGMEDAVARELFEEAGVRAHSVRYIASQPWPYPSSLMLGCIAKCEEADITLDENELEHAFWAERRDVVAAFETPNVAPFLLPPPLAIAHYIIQHWLNEQNG